QHKKQGPALRSEDQTPSSVFYYYIAFVQKSKCIFDRLKVFQLSFPLLQTNRILQAEPKKRKSGKMQRPARNHGIYAKSGAYLFIFSAGPVCAQGSPANFIPHPVRICSIRAVRAML